MSPQILRVINLLIYNDICKEDKYLSAEQIQAMSGYNKSEIEIAIQYLKDNNFLAINNYKSENETYRIASFEQFMKSHP